MGLIIDLTPWSIYLKPTPEPPYINLRELPGLKINPETGWGRYPISPFLAKELVDRFKGTATIHQGLFKLASAVDKIQTLKTLPKTLPEPPSKTRWWPHQLEAFYVFKSLYDAGFRGVGLFSELGTGKSKVAVGLVDYYKANMTLCIGPRSSLWVWYNEFRKHGSRVYEIITPSTFSDRLRCVKERLREVRARIAHARYPVVVLVNYEAVWRPPFGEWALEQVWDFVIADELHRIKTKDSHVSNFMAKLRDRAKKRIGLTGTPLHNQPLDIWGQYRFLDPGVYGLSYWDFKRRYSVVKNQVRYYKNEEEFSEKLYTISYRASRDVLKLPEAVFEERYGQLNKEAMKVYKSVEKEVIAKIKSGEITVNNALVRLIKLQEVTSGFVKDDEGNLQVIGHEKEELLNDFLYDFPKDEPLVIFCEFHYDLDVAKKVAESYGRTCAEISGRVNEFDLWRNGERDTLICQVRTGGQALDFTRSRYAVYYSFGLSLGDYQQSLARVHRAGQKRSVTYIHLLIRDTIDIRKLKYIERKSDIVRGLLEEYQKE